MLLTIKSTLQKLVSDSNILSGFRVLLAMSLTFLPSLFNVHIQFLSQTPLEISILLCLGVMASAIVEVDDNTKGRLKFIAMILISFFVSASFVEILMPYPVLFALGLFSSTFLFMMLAIYGGHYSKVGFGTLLIALYTMIGHQNSYAWYEQPFLLTLGALWYGLFAIAWNIYNPHNSLKEQLAQLYFAIARYQKTKSELFNETEGRTKEGRLNIRQQLAIRNVPIVARIAIAKVLIRLHSTTYKKLQLQTLNKYLNIAEQIHERISASQFLYSRLEDTFGKTKILEGYYQLFMQMSHECHQLGQAINNDVPYQHGRQLKWTIHALSDQLSLLETRSNENLDQEAMLGLKAIFRNLENINALLISASKEVDIELEAVDFKKQTLKKSTPATSSIKTIWLTFKNALSPSNTIFKHASRVSICMLIGFILQQGFQLEHGFWLLLTVLFVCQPSFTETRKRFTQRTIGTLAGIALGFLLLNLVDNILLQIVFLVFSAFLFFCYLRTNYGLSVVFITIFVIFVFNILTGTGIEILPHRIIETLLGCILSFLAITFIFPAWQFTRTPKLALQLLLLSNSYFKQVIIQYRFGLAHSPDFNKIRFDTFQANAALTTAWQSMLFEPKSKQTVNKEIYALVNRTDALVSYIAALSSHSHYIEEFDANFKLKKLLNLTIQQIEFACQSQANNAQTIIKSVAVESLLKNSDFEECKLDQNGEILLIIEQLRLIAFTAIDIQVLLQAINASPTTKRELHVI